MSIIECGRIIICDIRITTPHHFLAFMYENKNNSFITLLWSKLKKFGKEKLMDGEIKTKSGKITQKVIE
jgi:hypothetical protein